MTTGITSNNDLLRVAKLLKLNRLLQISNLYLLEFMKNRLSVKRSNRIRSGVSFNQDNGKSEPDQSMGGSIFAGIRRI